LQPHKEKGGIYHKAHLEITIHTSHLEITKNILAHLYKVHL